MSPTGATRLFQRVRRTLVTKGGTRVTGVVVSPRRKAKARLTRTSIIKVRTEATDRGLTSSCFEPQSRRTESSRARYRPIGPPVAVHNLVKYAKLLPQVGL
jgi:hypothetical protein